MHRQQGIVGEIVYRIGNTTRNSDLFSNKRSTSPGEFNYQWLSKEKNHYSKFSKKKKKSWQEDKRGSEINLPLRNLIFEKPYYTNWISYFWLPNSVVRLFTTPKIWKWTETKFNANNAQITKTSPCALSCERTRNSLVCSHSVILFEISFYRCLVGVCIVCVPFD